MFGYPVRWDSLFFLSSSISVSTIIVSDDLTAIFFYAAIAAFVVDLFIDHHSSLTLIMASTSYETK